MNVSVKRDAYIFLVVQRAGARRESFQAAGRARSSERGWLACRGKPWWAASDEISGRDASVILKFRPERFHHG